MSGEKGKKKLNRQGWVRFAEIEKEFNNG